MVRYNEVFSFAIVLCACGCGQALPGNKIGRGRRKKYVNVNHRVKAFKARARERKARESKEVKP